MNRPDLTLSYPNSNSVLSLTLTKNTYLLSNLILTMCEPALALISNAVFPYRSIQCNLQRIKGISNKREPIEAFSSLSSNQMHC